MADRMARAERARGGRIAAACALALIATIQCSIISGPRFDAPQPEDARVLPIACPAGWEPLEPSGLTLYEGRLLFISDNRQDAAIFEVFPGETEGEECRTAVFISLNKADLSRIPKRHTLDLEGIVTWNDDFYVVDERDRFIYRVDLSGAVEQVIHDIPEYNERHGISFSRDPNAAFEGIAVDPGRNIVFVANERDDPIIYVLRQTPNDLVLETERHIPMKDVLGGRSPDISDLCFDGGALYILHRIANRILRMDPESGEVTGSFDFSRAVAGLYTSRHGYGFAEGLFLDQDRIFLLLDSNGTPMFGTAHGSSGALVTLDRPADF